MHENRTGALYVNITTLDGALCVIMTALNYYYMHQLCERMLNAAHVAQATHWLGQYQWQGGGVCVCPSLHLLFLLQYLMLDLGREGGKGSGVHVHRGHLPLVGEVMGFKHRAPSGREGGREVRREGGRKRGRKEGREGARE